jgi:hypothetical protein
VPPGADDADGEVHGSLDAVSVEPRRDLVDQGSVSFRSAGVSPVIFPFALYP